MDTTMTPMDEKNPTDFQLLDLDPVGFRVKLHKFERSDLSHHPMLTTEIKLYKNMSSND